MPRKSRCQQAVGAGSAAWDAHLGCHEIANSRGFAGFDVTIANYLTPQSLAVCRKELPDCFIVHLQLSLAAARQRAKTRRVYLTDEEFNLLHRMVAVPPKADLVLDVDHLTQEQQIRTLRTGWTSA